MLCKPKLINKLKFDEYCDVPEDVEPEIKHSNLMKLTENHKNTPKFMLSSMINIKNKIKSTPKGKDWAIYNSSGSRLTKETKETMKTFNKEGKTGKKTTHSLFKNEAELDRNKLSHLEIERVIGPKLRLSRINSSLNWDNQIEVDSLNLTSQSNNIKPEEDYLDILRRESSCRDAHNLLKSPDISQARPLNMSQVENPSSIRKAQFEFPSAIEGPSGTNPSKVTFKEVVTVFKYYDPRSQSRSRSKQARKKKRNKRGRGDSKDKGNPRKKKKVKRRITGWFLSS